MSEIIINRYPPVIKRIKVIREIAKAEDIEFEKLKNLVNEVTNNMFIFTANETGISRFEKMLNIKKPKADLEARRMQVAAKMNSGKKSISELETILTQYDNSAHIRTDTDSMKMFVDIHATSKDWLDTMNGIVEETIPINIYFKINANDRGAYKIKLGMHTKLIKKITINDSGISMTGG